jgi:hypothetical protein
MTDQGKGFRPAEEGECCIARRASSGQIQVWNGTNWIMDSDYAQVFPSEAELKKYLDANPSVANEANLRVMKTGKMP